jgi:hypothetical protein
LKKKLAVPRRTALFLKIQYINIRRRHKYGWEPNHQSYAGRLYKRNHKRFTIDRAHHYPWNSDHYSKKHLQTENKKMKTNEPPLSGRLFFVYKVVPCLPDIYTRQDPTTSKTLPR